MRLPHLADLLHFWRIIRPNFLVCRSKGAAFEPLALLRTVLARSSERSTLEDLLEVLVEGLSLFLVLEPAEGSLWSQKTSLGRSR